MVDEILPIMGKKSRRDIRRSAKSERLAGFIKTLRTQTEPVAEFDERLWGAMMGYVTVGLNGGMTVVFRAGAAVSL